MGRSLGRAAGNRLELRVQPPCRAAAHRLAAPDQMSETARRTRPTEAPMRNPTITRPNHRSLHTVVALLVLTGGAGVAASPSATASSRIAAAPVVWDGPAPDGGYACLRDTGGASGQCNAAMG